MLTDKLMKAAISKLTFVLFSTLFLVLLTIAQPTAGQKNLPFEVREMARKVMMPVVYKVPGMSLWLLVMGVLMWTHRNTTI